MKCLLYIRKRNAVLASATGHREGKKRVAKEKLKKMKKSVDTAKGIC